MPENFGANLNLGRALLKTGDPQNAIAPLQKAIAGEPKKPAPHLALADVYQTLGRAADAMKERSEAERLGAVAPPSPVSPDAAPETNRFTPQQ
jgi:Tfp pilus assembly protein PilF